MPNAMTECGHLFWHVGLNTIVVRALPVNLQSTERYLHKSQDVYALDALANSSNNAIPTIRYHSPMRSWGNTFCVAKAVSWERLDACFVLVTKRMCLSNRPRFSWLKVQA